MKSLRTLLSTLTFFIPSVRNRPAMTAGCFAAGAILLLVFMTTAPTAAPAPPSQESPRPIPTAVARLASGVSIRTFPGKVRAARRVELAFSVSGTIDELNAPEGKSVRRGEILAQLDQRDFRLALDKARARLRHTARVLERNRTLLAQAVVSTARYDDAKEAYDIAAVELRLREKALQDSVLRAPFDGLIVRRQAEPHEYAQTGRAILSMRNVERIEVSFRVPEGLIARGGVAGLGEPEIHFDADADAGRWIAAEIAENAAEADSVAQTYNIVLKLAPPSGLTVYPGMTATVRARTREADARPADAPPLVRIPAKAVRQSSQGEAFVWTIPAAGGHPKRQIVVPVAAVGDSMDVANGPAPGEHVAVAGLHSLREEDMVRPMAPGQDGLDG